MHSTKSQNVPTRVDKATTRDQSQDYSGLAFISLDGICSQLASTRALLGSFQTLPDRLCCITVRLHLVIAPHRQLVNEVGFTPVLSNILIVDDPRRKLLEVLSVCLLSPFQLPVLQGLLGSACWRYGALPLLQSAAAVRCSSLQLPRSAVGSHGSS